MYLLSYHVTVVILEEHMILFVHSHSENILVDLVDSMWFIDLTIMHRLNQLLIKYDRFSESMTAKRPADIMDEMSHTADERATEIANFAIRA